MVGYEEDAQRWQYMKVIGHLHAPAALTSEQNSTYHLDKKRDPKLVWDFGYEENP
jgi:hypothetical protein